jgi:hypothetical protein
MVFARTADELDPVLPHEEMAVGRGRVDATRGNRLFMLDMRGRERPGAAQDLRKPADGRGRDVHQHEERGRKVSRQIAQQGGQGTNASSRGTDDDDVALGHPDVVL